MSQLIQGRFVTGMSWASIVARGDLPKMAQQKAIKDKGNWYAHHGQQTSVGIATLDKRDKPAKGERAYSVARLAAALNQFGPNFYAINMPEGTDFAGQVWICAVIDGVPVNLYDEIVTDVEAPQRLESFLEARGVSAGECGIYGDASGMPPSANPMGWNELILIPGNGDIAYLQPTRKSMLDAVSPQQKAIGLGLIVMIALYSAWGEYSKYRKKKQAAIEAAQQLDPMVEWTRVLTEWEATKSAPGIEPLAVLRRAMSTVPVAISGWDLKVLNCSFAAAYWTCVGKLDRSANRPLDPTTGDFLRNRPKEWIVTPKSLNDIEINFRVPVVSKPFQIDKTSQVAHHMEHTTSLLQRVGRAFGGVGMSDFTPVVIPVPVGPAGPIGKPPELALPVSSAVTLAGPMRSFDLKEVADLPVAWTNATIMINTATDMATLTASAVQMEAKGEIYAKP